MSRNVARAAIIAALLCSTSPVLAQSSPLQRFEIPAQSLGSALLALGRSARRNIIFAPATVAGKRSAAVAAMTTFEAALETLLAGTGFRAVAASDGTITLTLVARQAEVEDLAIEEIVVTADRPASFGASVVQVGTFRNARVIDTPLTINVIPRKLLESQAATGIYDALRNTAGVSRSETNGSTFDSLLIRGIQVDNRNSYKLNGVLPIINLASIPVENKERVEVLKGVGALYYGFAPPSGIVNIITKRADRDIVQFTGSVNEYGGADAAIDYGARVTDRFGVRVNAVAGIRDLGIDNYDGTRHLVAVALDWAATDALRLRERRQRRDRDGLDHTAARRLAARPAGRRQSDHLAAAAVESRQPGRQEPAYRCRADQCPAPR